MTEPPSRPEPDDEDLMLAVRAGDREAFGRLVLRHQQAAWGACYRFVGDPAEAEDLAQQAFLKILEAADRYEPSASFRTYLYRVVTRLCLDYREKRRPTVGEALSGAQAAVPGPPEAAVERERGEAVREALLELPVRQRLAVILRYSEGLSLRDVAGAMEATEKAVEHLQSRSRETLAGRLGEWIRD
jgi:RNA polymerase sigma-70 factor (ECF subfamily)